MKRLLLLLLTVPLLGLTSCDPIEDQGPTRVSMYKPVLMDEAGLNNSIVFLPEGKQLHAPGKIYAYGNLLLMSDRYDGIHFFDNSNPESPKSAGFLAVPGVTDMAIKGDVLYLNNATDLVAVSLTSLVSGEAKVLSRIEDAFPEIDSAPDGLPLAEEYRAENRPANTVIVRWESI